MPKPLKQVEPDEDELHTLRKSLGARIRQFRTGRGWSQDQFAANAGIHRTFVGALERGEQNVSFHSLVTVAKSLGITLGELLKGIESSEQPSQRGVAVAETEWKLIRSEIQEMERRLLALKRDVDRRK